MEEPPPILGTWRRLYTAIVFYLVVLITLLYLLSRYFS